jgi:flavin reductase (DIM6/NTAB) family NADH-FMN oxidoreductase RutF
MSATVGVPPKPQEFREAMAELPAAVTIVTARAADGAPMGATVSAVLSLSLEPPLLLVCLADESDTCQAIAAGSPFLVHVLRQGQEEIARQFARKGAQKFAATAWRPGWRGLPLLEDCALVHGCDVHSLLPGGDHVIVVGAVREIDRAGGAPLVYHRRRFHSTPR